MGNSFYADLSGVPLKRDSRSIVIILNVIEWLSKVIVLSLTCEASGEEGQTRQPGFSDDDGLQ